MVEGGAGIIGALLTDAAKHCAAPLISNVVVTIAPIYLLQTSGTGAPVRIDARAPSGEAGQGAQPLSTRLRLREPRATLVGEDLVLVGCGILVE